MRLDEITQASMLQWFAGSKVVDAHGKPLRVYHGTGTPGDIQTFSDEHSSKTALYGPGFYFTDHPEIAGGMDNARDEDELDAKSDFQLSGYAFHRRNYTIKTPLTKKQLAYAKRLFGSNYVIQSAHEDIGSRRFWAEGWKKFNTDEPTFREWVANSAPKWFQQKLKVDAVKTNRPAVYPVYLKIVNPFDMRKPVTLDLFKKMWDAVGTDHSETFENATSGFENMRRQLIGGDAWEWLARRVMGDWSGEGKTNANHILKKLGYDGIVDKSRNAMNTISHNVWVAFYPNQIKSVFAQKFSDSPNISESKYHR
jgi:hypothetical protein